MKGLHGELFGVLGAPSPRADPALLAGLGAGWCTLYKERGTTTYSAALARTPVHHPQASTLQQGRVAPLQVHRAAKPEMQLDQICSRARWT